MKKQFVFKFIAFGVPVFLCCAVFINSDVRAQAAWTVHGLIPQNSDLYSIVGFPNGLAVCVGANGVIERSTDTGKTWAIQEYNGLTFNGVASADGEHFVAISSEGEFAVSSDSAVSWLLPPEGFPARYPPLRGITADSSSFVAVGDVDAIALNNFGISWVIGGGDDDMNAVVALSSTVKIDVACGDSGSIRRTNYWGTTWDTIESGTTANLRHIVLNPNGSLFAYGDEWTVVTSTDTGTTWRKIEIDSLNRAKYPSGSVRNIVFFSPTHGFAFVAQPGAGLLNDYVTEDGGLTWQILNIPDFNDDDDAAVAIDTMRGIKVGQLGGIFLTKDQGHSWGQVNKQSSDNYACLAFSSPSNGFLALHASNYEIERSTDAGADWSNVFVTPSAVVGMVFPTVAVGFAYGNGFVARTVDSGASWNTIATTSVGNVLWGSFSSPNHGVLLTTSGSIFETSDSGTSWKQLHGPSENPVGLLSISLLGQDTVIVLGNGFVFRSINGGDDWESVPIPYSSKSMRFLSSGRGWIVGSGLRSEPVIGSVILSSTDAGLSWSPQLLDTSDVSEGLSDIAFADDGHAIATDYFSLGHKPPVYETSDGGVTWMRDTMRDIPPPQNISGPQNFCGVAYPSLNTAYLLTQSGNLFSGIFATSGVRVSSANLFSNLSVYPNPCDGNAVTVLFPPDKGALQLSVWDVSGKLRFQLSATLENRATIPLGSLPEGSYYLDVTGNNFSRSIPFVRQK